MDGEKWEEDRRGWMDDGSDKVVLSTCGDAKESI